MLLCSEHFMMVCTSVRLFYFKLTTQCLVLECGPSLCCFLLVILQCKMLYCCMDFFVFPTLWLSRSHFQRLLFLSILFQVILKYVQHYQQYLIFLLNFIVVKTNLLKNSTFVFFLQLYWDFSKKRLFLGKKESFQFPPSSFRRCPKPALFSISVSSVLRCVHASGCIRQCS